MALSTPQQLGIQAPQGGFQQGAWYSGRQFWNGQLGDPGVIINPNQPGYQQPVSEEVNKQTSVAAGLPPGANQAYINAGAPVNQSSTIVAGTNAGASANSSANVQAFLDNYQSSAQSVAESVDPNMTDEQVLSEIRSAVTPTTPEPQAPNLSQTYQNLVVTSGLSNLQTQQTTLMSQAATIQSSLEAQQANEEAQGGTVPLNVIAGRQTEEQRQAQVKLDSINLQLGVVNQAISNAQNGIGIVMQYTQQDYQNASTQYENEFNNNMSMYQAFQSTVKQQQDYRMQLQQTAAANLQTIANLITSGNISWSNMSPTEQTQINGLEIQAGLPIGTMSQIQMSPKDRLLNVTSYRGQVQALTMGPDGKLNIQTFGSVQTGGTVTEQKQQYQDSALQDAQSGVTYDDLVSIYSPYLTENEIYDIYNQANYYGRPPDKTAAQLRSSGVTQIPYSATQ